MKSHIIQKIDLILCSAWAFGILSLRHGNIFLPLILVFLRVVISFCLHEHEKRTLIHLAAYLGLWIPAFIKAPAFYGISKAVRYSFAALGYEGSTAPEMLVRILIVLLFLWLAVGPFLCYLILLLRHSLVKTNMKACDLLGAILWHERTARCFSMIFIIVVISIFTGITMYTRMRFVGMLLSIVVGYSLLCQYRRMRAKNIWMLIAASLLFWFAQYTVRVWKIAILLSSLCMVIYICVTAFKETKYRTLDISLSVLLLGILLPSLNMGFNQWACIKYSIITSRIQTYNGLFCIKNSDGLYGLRSRYGILLDPVYEYPINEFRTSSNGIFNYRYLKLQKDGFTQVFDVYSSEILPCSIDDNIQHDLCTVLTEFFINEADEDKSSFEDCGEIVVKDISDSALIAHLRMMVDTDGNPYAIYEDDSEFIPDIEEETTSFEYCKRDSVAIYETPYRSCVKNIISYAEDIFYGQQGFNLYVRLAQTSPQEENIDAIMEEVRDLQSIREYVPVETTY